MRRKIASKSPHQYTSQEIRDALDQNIWQDTFGREDAKGITDKEITKLWTEHMHDFVPEDMVNFVLKDQSHNVLFETISH